MSIEHVCIVGFVGCTEEEKLRGCVDGCATCGAIGEEYLRVDGRLLCPRCAARIWNVERATHVELAAERTADVRRMVEELDARADRERALKVVRAVHPSAGIDPRDLIHVSTLTGCGHTEKGNP
jgi:DNA-directed RNA polymerase subunit RPC12/RpoP